MKSSLRESTITGRSQTISLEIASRLELIDVIQVALSRLATSIGFDADATHYMSVAVRESTINAIRHGNRFDAAKRVWVAFVTSSDTIEIRVRDEGTGFDPLRIRDPLADENLLRADGRGVFFMRSFMDEVTFSFPNGGGTIVTMLKRLGSPVVRPAEEKAG
jgi:serine/threonine-protein kinase RsbW